MRLAATPLTPRPARNPGSRAAQAEAVAARLVVEVLVAVVEVVSGTAR
jgi:hypothetical protein